MRRKKVRKRKKEIFLLSKTKKINRRNIERLILRYVPEE